MSKEERPAPVDMLWLANGEKDLHPRYVEIGREELMGAHRLSDDELAWHLAMMSTISEAEDTQRMMQSHRTGGDYINKSTLGEMGKDRIRWLSRRVAVLEGRYPGVLPPISAQPAPPVALDDIKIDPPELVAEAELEFHLPRLTAVLGITPDTPSTSVPRILREKKFGLNPVKVGIVFGHLLKSKSSERWHLYVEMVRDLLKNYKLYVPFREDEFSLIRHERGERTVLIGKSRYLSSGSHVIRETPTTGFSQQAIDHEAEKIYNSWKEQEGWTPWQKGGNSTKQTEARQLALQALTKEHNDV